MNARIAINLNIRQRVFDFYNRMLSVQNHRYRSWEHCFEYFQQLRAKEKVDKIDIDLASLNLAFYLASWGMYRGRCFILQYDYHAHINIVAEILKPENKNLLDINFESVKAEGDELICLSKLHVNLGKIYKEIDGVGDKKATDTLITKVILGTIACTPAFDSYVKEGMRAAELPVSEDLHKNILSVIKYYQDNSGQFNEVQKEISDKGYNYPVMKIVDMYFWEIGNEIARIKKEKERLRKEAAKPITSEKEK